MDDAEEIDGNDDAGVALVRAYNFAKDELEENGKALSFLAGVCCQNLSLRMDFV